MIRYLLALILLTTSLPAAHAAQDCVILLHGLGRGAGSMNAIEADLKANGFRVWNKSYPSTEQSVSQLSQTAIQPGLQFCLGLTRTHFVTHSLGGILVRSFLQDKQFDGRIVMLSPPNKGSEIPDVLKEIALFETLLGPAAMELGTDAQSRPNTLAEIEGEIGIIAGDSTSDPWFSWLIPGDDDGKVSVESTQLAEMKDFLQVNHGHTFIMRSDDVIYQIRYFLRHGLFAHGKPED